MFNQTKRVRCEAFTLIELLVVISIILIASSIIFIGGNSGAGASLSSSTRIVSGISQGARGQAILKNASVRLIINNDLNDIDKYRRHFGIVYRGQDIADPADPTGPPLKQWIAATQGTYLPEGVYFDAATSSAESGSAWSVANSMKLEYPRVRAVPENGGSDYLYYEFFTNGNSANSNAYLVLRCGTVIPNTTGDAVSEIRVNPEDLFLRSALIFRRAGTTTSVSMPEDISVSSDVEVK